MKFVVVDDDDDDDDDDRVLNLSATTQLWKSRGGGAHGGARGCTGCICTPQGGEKNFGPDLQRKVVNAPAGRECTPQAEQESNF